jgi:Uncharacterised nucleotidyltransferase
LPVGRRICGEGDYPAPLLAVAGHRLPGANRAFPAEPLDDRAWTTLVASAYRNRVTGLLHAAADDGALPATPEQVGEARTLHRSVQVRVLGLERELPAVVRTLDTAGVESRVLKGCAVARLDYRDPGLRSFVDLDVLVRSRDVDRAVAALAAVGFARTLAEPRPGFDRRFDKGMTLIPPAGYELDLHRTFVLGPWGVVIDLEQLWDEGVELPIGVHTVRALSRPNRFLHACYHAALGDWPLRLASLRDVAEIADRLDGAATVRGIAESWSAEAVVAAAVADSRRLLGTDADDDLTTWSRRYVPSRRDESWLALHTRPDKTFAAQALATVRALPRWPDRVAYVRALLLPDRSYTAGRHGSAWSRLRYAVREVRRGTAARRPP